MSLTPAAVNRLSRVRLLDVYRQALTERQRRALRLHLEEDWSLAELARAMGTSRAAAYDLIRRGLGRMEALERELGACRRLELAEREMERLRRRLRRLERQLATPPPEPGR